MLQKTTRYFWRTALLVALLGGLLLLGSRLATLLYARPRTFTVRDVPNSPVAIVFGAGLRRDGAPTPVLRDRVTVAADLYFRGKVKKLLMSGDNRSASYNEPAAMRDYAVQLGVPAADIVLDYAGRRTYDTCYRAGAIFQVSQAILVTQGFHLPRAVYLCNQLGVKAQGVASDLVPYRKRSQILWNIRETPATLVALWEVHVSQPVPVLGQPEPIFPESVEEVLFQEA